MLYKFERGGFGVHTLTAPYALLVQAFGDDGLTAERDDYKSMATWDVGIGVDFVEVYDYKVGTCYDPSTGQHLVDITEWHVQGTDSGIDRMLALLDAQEPRTVPVVFDPELHSRAPQTPREQLTWAALDTAYNLMRETAVRLMMLEIREAAGPDFPSDEELFARQDGVKTYLDLAEHDEDVCDAVDLGFQVLFTKTHKSASVAIARLNGEGA